MTPDRWRQIEELCHAALTRPADEHAAFLANACAGDAALLREVESLLAQASDAARFMSVPAAAVADAAVVDQAKGTLVGQRLGAYEIRALLGFGGMGEVYRAYDETLEREVAIKVLPPAFTADPQRRARFEREARLLATLNHPNIGAIYGFEEMDGVRGLVLELVEGETLAERIAVGGQAPSGPLRAAGSNAPGLPVTEVLALARQIAEALDVAHEKGIVHRDLKPANIKITPDGVVKVLDFGLAKPAASPDTSRADLTESRDGVILGTAAYVSPEQARGNSVDKRTDIWAFGCVLYEMLTGRLAFAGDTASDTIVKILEHEPDWSALPASTPVPIQVLLRRCLAKNPKQRLRDIGDVRIEIESIDAVPTGVSDTAPSPGYVKARTARLPWVAAGALAFALVLTLMLWAPWRTVSPPDQQRLSVDLGADASLGALNLQFGGATALSPDGDVVAFVAQKGEGKPQIYVRRLAQLQATPLSGTDDALVPFFSPDGRWIGFFADQKLKKVAVTGGAPVSLADAPSTRGGAWGEDGTIAFSPNQTAGTRLLRVSSTGGKAEPLTSLAEGEVIQIWPQVLPGGKAVLYTSSGSLRPYNDADLVVQSLPSGARKVVQRGGYHGVYLPSGLGSPRRAERESGHLVYIHDGTLFAVPFDLERLEVTGQPVPALEGVKSNSLTGGAQFAVSANGTLAYLPGTMLGGGGGASLDWMDREGKTTPMRTTPAIWFTPQFAPDGSRLALDIREELSDIWVYEWARDTLTRVTSDPVGATRPVWTPDGRRIVFASARADKVTRNLYLQRADGTGEAQRLTESKNPQAPSSWHPSGRFLAFEEIASSPNAKTNVDVMILPLEGDENVGWKPGKPMVYLNGPAIEASPTFSPDGRWLAYTSQESGRPEVYVRPFPGPGGKWQVSTGGGHNPVWSRARHELFYGQRDNGQIMVAAFKVEGDSFRAEKPRLWSEGRYQVRGANRMFDLHPDGERFVLAAAPQTPAGAKQDKVVFISNFFDELRRIAPATPR